MTDVQMDPTSSMSSLPSPPSFANAPGQQAPNGQGQGNNQLHMPPAPLQPVIIPQNVNNPIPSALSGGNPDGTGMTSPNGQNSFVRRAAPEPNKRSLYVGGLDARVTDDMLRQIFETTGHVTNVKIIPDKSAGAGRGINYGFIDYDDPAAAERAMQTLNGRRVHNSEIRVNWAYQANNTTKEDTSGHFHIFVGDLSNEVNDDILLQAFSAFGSVSEARVMWDMKTGRSRGYGFVAFRDRPDAEKALNSMDGEWLGSRAIRCNWANQKGQPSVAQQQAMSSMGMTPTTPYGHHQFPANGPQSYDMVVSQTPQWQTTCYVGNLTPYTTQNDVVPLFNNFGFVVETRFQSDRGFAFIKMDSHENAAMAICQLNGYNVNGRPLKCSWGKDRPPTNQFDAFSPQGAQFNQQPSFGYPQYAGAQGGPHGAGGVPGYGNTQSPMGAPNGGGRGFAPNNFNGHAASSQSYGQMPGSGGAYGRPDQMDDGVSFLKTFSSPFFERSSACFGDSDSDSEVKARRDLFLKPYRVSISSLPSPG